MAFFHCGTFQRKKFSILLTSLDFLRNCINCVHNCEDHSSFDFISAVLLKFISYTSITFILSLEHKKTWLTSFSGSKAQLVWASHRYREVTGSNPVQVLNFLQTSYAIALSTITKNMLCHPGPPAWLRQTLQALCMGTTRFRHESCS